MAIVARMPPATASAAMARLTRQPMEKRPPSVTKNSLREVPGARCYPSLVPRTFDPRVVAGHERLALRLPASYLEAVAGQGVAWRQWRFFSLDEVGRLDDRLGASAVGVVIAIHRDGYVQGLHDVPHLCLLASATEPGVLQDAIYRRSPVGRMKKIAPSLGALFAKKRLPSLASLEREHGRKRAPAKRPPSAESAELHDMLKRLGPSGASDVLRAARGDLGDYLRLVYTKGPLSRAYVAWKLSFDEERVAEIARAALEAVARAGSDPS